MTQFRIRSILLDPEPRSFNKHQRGNAHPRLHMVFELLDINNLSFDRKNRFLYTRRLHGCCWGLMETGYLPFRDAVWCINGGRVDGLDHVLRDGVNHYFASFFQIAECILDALWAG